MELITAISSLDTRFQPIAAQLVREIEEAGIKIRVGETRRVLPTQMAYFSVTRMSVENVKLMYKAAGLYAIGDKEAAGPKKCDTIDSYHLRGLAIDIIPQIKNSKGVWIDWWGADEATWKKMGEIGMSLGLTWGGNFGKTASKLGWDCPHFELRI